MLTTVSMFQFSVNFFKCLNLSFFRVQELKKETCKYTYLARLPPTSELASSSVVHPSSSVNSFIYFTRNNNKQTTKKLLMNEITLTYELKSSVIFGYLRKLFFFISFWEWSCTFTWRDKNLLFRFPT